MKKLPNLFHPAILASVCLSLAAPAQVNFNAAALFGLRKLNPAYSGKALNVRRSSDNATLDIGFTSCGFLDTTALKSFVGASSGYVNTWYDQSGNGRNASQATAASQPRIVNAGAVDYVNSRVAIVWPGTNSSGIYLSYNTNTNVRTVNAVRDFKVNPFPSSGDAMQYLFSSPANSDFSIRLSSTGSFSYDGDNNSNDWITSSGSPKLCWVNGTQTTTPQFNLHTVTATAPNVVNGSFSIGSTFLNRNLYNNDAVSELVAYPGTLTTTQRTLIETAEATIYNLSVSNSKYTPPTATTYNLFVNGVGRESATDSVAGTRSSVGMGISIGNGSGDFLKNNGDYITFGSNCPTATVSTANLPGGFDQRWANDWFINKTDVSNNNGTVVIYFDFDDYGVGIAPGPATHYDLLKRTTPSGNFTAVTGTTKSVVGHRVLFSLNASNITDDNYYTIGSKNISASPLPIELSNFQCQVSAQQQVVLNWSTASELNNAYFEIERSANAADYESLGRLKGAGTSHIKNDYSFEDHAPLQGIAYYRLKQVDADGTPTLHNACSVNVGGNTTFKVYPNPAGNYIDVEAPGYATVSVLQSQGALLYKEQFTGKTRISTADWQAGFYTVKIESGDISSMQKLVVQH